MCICAYPSAILADAVSRRRPISGAVKKTAEDFVGTQCCGLYGKAVSPPAHHSVSIAESNVPRGRKANARVPVALSPYRGRVMQQLQSSLYAENLSLDRICSLPFSVKPMRLARMRPGASVIYSWTTFSPCAHESVIWNEALTLNCRE
jgi:hypothetical protein